MLTEIDHVAIAVHDLEAAIEYYRATSGSSPSTASASRRTGSTRP